MSYLRMYREDYIKDNDLEYMYINHTEKFVNFMEQEDYGDKIFEIQIQQLEDSVANCNKNGDIKRISTMENHLNAIKNFFVYLHKNGKADNIFNRITDYDKFKQKIILDNNLKPTSTRGYIDEDQIKELLDYFNSFPTKPVNMTMMGFFFKITLLVPTKRQVISNLKVSDFSENFSIVKINDFSIKLPRALSLDIRREISKANKNISESSLFFEIFFNSKKYNENVFNTPFYYALKQIGYDLPTNKSPSFSVECIRNTGIINLTSNGTNPYLIARLTGLSLSGIDKLLKTFKIDIDDKKSNNSIDEVINTEICKFKYYQDI